MPTVRASALIEAPIEKVWEHLRDFGAHATWVHGATSMELIGGTGSTVGVIREFTLDNGPVMTEVLTGHSDKTYSLTYQLVGDIPWPVYNVNGLIRLHAVTSTNITLIERVVDFDTTLEPEKAEQLTQSFGDVFLSGFELLAKVVG